MGFSVVNDRFADVTRVADGVVLHQRVRIQVDNTGRVAVFTSPTAGPGYVYGPGEVSYNRLSASCSHPVCYGKASRQTLTRLWQNAEAAGS